jgi:hypothetical protein
MMGLYGVAYYLLLELSSVSDALQVCRYLDLLIRIIFNSSTSSLIMMLNLLKEKTLLPLETAYSVYTFLPLVFLDLIFWVWVRFRSIIISII